MTPRPPCAPQPPRPPRLHHDPLAGRVVVIAPERAERPSDSGAADARWAVPGEPCPFCAGQEARTPPAVLRAPADPALPWHARIVANRFPLVADGPAAGRTPEDRHAAVRPARGVHEVVIESPTHETSILALTPPAWRDVWQLCRRRLEMVAARDDLAWATVFKNSGPRAGASLAHVHSQLIGLDFVPPAIEAELAALASCSGGVNRLLAAAEAGGRVVAEAAGLVALVPPAPRQPFETWILPVRPAAFFHAAEPASVAALADLSRAVIGRLERLVPEVEYNWWLHQAPFAAGRAAAAAWHWHLEILPRITPLAGFELGTSCHVTTLPPDEAASLLRGAAAR